MGHHIIVIGQTYMLKVYLTDLENYITWSVTSEFILQQYCLLSKWKNEDIIAKLNTIRNNPVRLWLDLLKQIRYMNLLKAILKYGLLVTLFVRTTW